MEQLSLNYEPLQNVAGRPYVQANFAQTAKNAYWARLGDISVREGYNDRRNYGDIESLAASIMTGVNVEENAVYLKTPMDLWVTTDAKKLVKRGHRRLRAMLLNVEKGKMNLDMVVQFFFVSPKESEFESKADVILSNEAEGLSWYEKSLTVIQLKNNYSEFPKSHEEIALAVGLSRQTIDNYIAIHEEGNDVLRNLIQTENMSLNKALELIRSQRKLKRDADKEEVKAGQSSMYVSQEKDPLADELKELKDLENTPGPDDDEEEEDMETEEQKQQRILRENTKRDQELEQLLAISDEVKVSHETLVQHLDKKLSADVVAGWVENFLDEDTGAVVKIDRKKVVAYKNSVLTDDLVKEIVDNKVETVFFYQKGKEPIAASVITVQPEGEEKIRYDESRPEVAQIQNCIKLADRIEARVNKIDCDEGTKKDIADFVKWMQTDLVELREWIHKNKKQNKMR